MVETGKTEMGGDKELQKSDTNRGGWITFPFMLATSFGLTVAAMGWLMNVLVYLILEFHVKSITAVKISNVFYGCISLLPVAGAIVADSFVGTFAVVSISSYICLLGLVGFALTASLKSLRPQHCEVGSSLCQSPSTAQFAVLYTAIALALVGSGGTRFTLSTAGANQFDKPKDQTFYFSWFFFITYLAAVISATVVVYVQNNVSWAIGYGICIAANLVGSVIFLAGKRFYRLDKPQGSPFTSLIRVVVSAIRKRKVLLSSRYEDYYYKLNQSSSTAIAAPTTKLRFLNRAAIKTEGDVQSDGSIAKPWRLCTVQQVEDLKSLIRIFPVWSTSIFLTTPPAIQMNMTVLQALTMDRHMGPNFKFPAGSVQVVILLTTCITLSLIDKVVLPLWKKLIRRSPTLLQRVGVGHVLSILSMVVSAIVESKRLRVVQNHKLENNTNSVVPMLGLWLFPQLIIVGIGEAFHFPANVALFYREFPLALRSTATAMASLLTGIAFYLATALIDLAQRETNWLPDNINRGKLNYLYWSLAVVGVVNFGYFLFCACLYEYKDIDEEENSVSSSSK